MAARTAVATLALVVAALLAPGASSPPGPGAARAAPAQPGFVETTVFSGLTQPTVVRFAADGRVFVGEKSGLIKVFDSINDPTPDQFADLRTNVHNYWDRGLLGLALHPQFPTVPYVYALYTYDHELGSPDPAPRWSDACPTPPGPTTDGCVVSGRLSRLEAAGNTMTGTERVLIEDWCQQFPSHSIGTVEFGPDGALYASAGDGASFTFADYGQAGSPRNPCGDPPGGAGATLTPPTAEGGALRTQDLQTPADPTGLDGTIIRIDPATGEALPTNPLASSADPNARRIIAYGLRNPMRFSFRPGTSEIWLGDVGWNDWEEINRIISPTDAVVENFGWPCFEGTPRQPGYDGLGLTLCSGLQQSAVVDPYFAYRHADKVVPGEACPSGGSSITGISFEFAPNGSNFPADYAGALFFADYTRDCIWVMKKGGNPIPSPGQIQTFVANAANPVQLEFGPDGNLYYVDFDGGTIRRISPGTAQPPASSYLSDLTWASMSNGYGPVEKDMSNGEEAQGDGRTLTLNGVTYAKGLGAHAPSDVRYTLAGGCSRFTASVGIDDEVGNNGTVVFQVFADTTKVYDSGTMTGASVTKSIDVSVSGAAELRLVVTDAGDNAFYDHADWALARVECGGGGGDTTPPTVTGQTPGAGATGVQLGVTPTVTFSEAMSAATITTGTFTLTKQGAGAPVPATVSYSAGTQTATLTPSSPLDPDSNYTATVLGGSTGVKDLAGNPLAADSSWSFRTQAVVNQPPTATIDSPLATLTWKVADAIVFSGRATDPEQGTLPASALSWSLSMEHCPSTCHSHQIQTWSGVASGSFAAPDHEYPSHLQLRLTATDAAGASTTTSIDLYPVTVVLTFATSPTGLQLSVNGAAAAAAFSRTVIVGSSNSLSAPATQTLNGTTYDFVSWSDGGARVHNITAPAAATTYTATYGPPSKPVNTVAPSITGIPQVGQTMTAAPGEWKGSQPMTFAFQWYRCTASLNSCVIISGATAMTYTTVAADRTKRLRVRVVATNAYGSGVAVSASTSKIS